MATPKDGDKLATGTEGAITLAVMDPARRVDLALVEEVLGSEVKLRAALTTVKMPSGGSRTWEIEDPESDTPEATPTLEGVVIGFRKANSYWHAKAGDGENSPPDCASGDAVVAFGIRVGLGETDACAHFCGVERQEGCCPLNEYGSDPGGGKACKNTRELLFLRADETLPLIVSLPPTSIAAFEGYLTKHLLRGRRPQAMVTRISLEKVGDGANAYSRATFGYGGPIDDEATVNFLSLFGSQLLDMTERTQPVIAATAATDASVMPDASEAF